MAGYVEVDEASDHLLILCVVFCRFPLEEIDAGLTQSNRDLDVALLECQFLRGRQEIVNYTKIAQRFISVFDFVLHIFSSLFASILRQICGSGYLYM